MNVDMLREAARTQPFRPFLLRMNDGRVLQIPHPDCIAVARRTVIVVDPITDRELLLEPVLIASLEYVSPSQPAAPGTTTTGGTNS